MDTPSRKTAGVPRGVLLTALLVVILWGIAAGRPFLVPVLLSALLAFLMNPLVRVLERRRVPDWISVTVSAVLLMLPIAVAISFAALEIQALVDDLPAITRAL